jgi:hypothetical protein
MAQFLPDRETSLFARPTMDAFAQDATQAVVTAQINFIRRLSAEIQTVSCPELQRQAQNVITMTPGAKRWRRTIKQRTRAEHRQIQRLVAEKG